MGKKNIVMYCIFIIVIALLCWYFFLSPKHNTELIEGGSMLSYDKPFSSVELPEGVPDYVIERMNYTIDNAKKMHEEAPDIWETWIAIGNMYGMIGKYEYAIDAYLKSLEIQGNNIVAHRNIAEVYRVNLKDNNRAEQYYKIAIEQNFSDPSLYLTLSKIQYKQLNNLENAEKTLFDGLQKTGGHPDILVAIITLYEDSGQIQKQKEVVKTLLTRFPDNQLYKEAWGDLVE